MTLFVGLGNPGSQYEETRHNIGFKVIDVLVEEHGARDISKPAFNGKLYRCTSALFLKPTTFMNLSGKSVLPVKQFFKIETDNIIVIHDDIDLPFGAVRFKRGGGNGGHNGLKSIDSMIGKSYLRIRIGVGKPERKSQVPDYVLAPFSTQEAAHLDTLVSYVAKAANALLHNELDTVKSCYSLKSIEGIAT